MVTLALQAPTLFAPRIQMARKVEAVPVQKATCAQIAIQVRENSTDEELILAICGGAEWALELLYQRYSRYAYALAYGILHDISAVEDIVQECFLSIWYKAASYQRQQGSVRSWLQAIIHHRSVDRLRAAAHRDAQCTSLQNENAPDRPSEQPDVEEQAWRDEQQSLIRSALEQIPVEQRQVIELAYFGGFTHAEIAEKFGIPLGTVKGRMRLGLQKMKLLLQEWEAEMA